MRVMHIITGLNTGGAEMMLCRILGPLRAAGVDNLVITLSEEGPVASMIRARGVTVKYIPLYKFPVLINTIREYAPDLVQTWMYHADLFGGLAARLAGINKVVWGIQNGTIDRKGTKLTTRLVVRSCARFGSKIASKIIACGNSVVDIHAQAGFPRDRMVVIHNGIDVAEFQPDTGRKNQSRQTFGIAPDAFVIAQFARYDPQKDYENFISAAGIVERQAPGKCCYVLCGSNVDERNTALVAELERAGVRDRTHLLGLQRDVRPIMVCADIACLSSRFGEGLPLSIGESMAMQLPCVVTDVGDSGYLVGDTGITVPPGDPTRLAAGWIKMLELTVEKRLQMGRAARQRIMDHFSLTNTAGRYLQLYRDLVAAATAAQPN